MSNSLWDVPKAHHIPSEIVLSARVALLCCVLVRNKAHELSAFSQLTLLDMKRGHPPESILCLHDWRGAGERTLVTPAPARHDTEILHFLCESKFGQVICTSVVPLHCFGKAGGNPGVGTRLSWETPAFLPL